jgi:hypothetical protein
MEDTTPLPNTPLSRRSKRKVMPSVRLSPKSPESEASTWTHPPTLAHSSPQQLDSSSSAVATLGFATQEGPQQLDHFGVPMGPAEGSPLTSRPRHVQATLSPTCPQGATSSHGRAGRSEKRAAAALAAQVDGSAVMSVGGCSLGRPGHRLHVEEAVMVCAAPSTAAGAAAGSECAGPQAGEDAPADGSEASERRTGKRVRNSTKRFVAESDNGDALQGAPRLNRHLCVCS